MQSYFFFNDTATTEIYTLSLHDALPIFRGDGGGRALPRRPDPRLGPTGSGGDEHLRSGGKVRSGQAGGAYPSDRKSTRLNSSHANISYAVFCLKKTNTAIDSQSCGIGAA